MRHISRNDAGVEYPGGMLGAHFLLENAGSSKMTMVTIMTIRAYHGLSRLDCRTGEGEI